MSVSKDTVLHTADLSRLDLRSTLQADSPDGAAVDARLEVFAAQMEEIVGYMDILQSAKTDGVEPMYSPMGLTAGPREDEVRQEYTREEELSNAPEQADGFFLVPRVI